ncbi:MAG: pyruvate kinase alpha/beta domain-containing protein [Desulfatiglandales bacterium]|jgi:hypothetical protein
MGERVLETVYFDQPGPANTNRTLEIVQSRASELGINTILVATTQGNTGLLATERFHGLNTVVVTHSTGFKEPNSQELTTENRAAIERAGGKILTAMHALGGLNRAVRIKLGTYQLDEVIAFVLRTLGQGFKVCVEISLMAADAGLVRTGEPCIAIGGTGRGVDTAVVLSPANGQTFFDIRIHEIMCKPYL